MNHHILASLDASHGSTERDTLDKSSLERKRKNRALANVRKSKRGRTIRAEPRRGDREVVYARLSPENDSIAEVGDKTNNRQERLEIFLRKTLGGDDETSTHAEKVREN